MPKPHAKANREDDPISALGHLNRLFVVLPALLLGPALALAVADGPDFYRLVDVAADDVLNIRAGPGTEHPIVGAIPANADGIANIGCVGGLDSGQPLWTCSIRRLVKRVARSAGLPEPVADQLSSHSMRVGAAQDMMVTGFDMLAIMQAGGWTTPHVVSRYVENASTRSLHERRWAALEGLASFVSARSKSGADCERF